MTRLISIVFIISLLMGCGKAELADKLDDALLELNSTKTALSQSTDKLAETQARLDQTQSDLKKSEAEIEVLNQRLFKVEAELEATKTELATTKSNRYGVTIPTTLIGAHFLLYSEKSEGLIFIAPKEHRGILRKIENGEVTLLGTFLQQKDQILVISFDSIIGYRLLPKPE